jgi:enoyl-CoA hydratase
MRTPTTEHRVEGPLHFVQICRPDRRNAIDCDTAAALADHFRAFEADPEARIAILSGHGGHFCAGADLQAIAQGRPNRVENTGDGPLGPTRMRLSKPVIAAIEGACVAGGLELAAWADLRVAAEGAYFGVYCRRFGVPLIDGGTVRLPRLIGESRAMDWILTGRRIELSEAVSAGFVHRTSLRGSAESAARAWAEELVRLPRTCMEQDRLAMIEGWDLDLEAGLSNELAHGRISLTGVADRAATFRQRAGE